MKQLNLYLKKARNIVEYYRTGPLGDVPAINGKLVEEALRYAMQEDDLGKVGTRGLVDLSVQPWKAGYQVKTHRKKAGSFIFCRSDKGDVVSRIADVKNRIISDLTKLELKKLYLLDIGILDDNFGLYTLAKLKKSGMLQTCGSFLKESHVRILPNQTHFRIYKEGLIVS